MLNLLTLCTIRENSPDSLKYVPAMQLPHTAELVAPVQVFMDCIRIFHSNIFHVDFELNTDPQPMKMNQLDKLYSLKQ